MKKEIEPEEMVKYLGRDVTKRGFRVFMHGRDGKKMLVNSWDEYEVYLASGEWFSQVADILDDPKNVPMINAQAEVFKSTEKRLKIQGK
jgi:hypothetical protein